MDEAPTSIARPQTRTAWQRLHRNRKLWCVAIVCGLIVAAPWIATRTSLKDRYVDYKAAQRDATATVDRVDWGWLTRLDMQGVQVRSLDGVVEFDADRVRTTRTWITWPLSKPDWGHVEVHRPRVRVHLPDPWEPPPEASVRKQSQTVFDAELQDIEVQVFQGERPHPVFAFRQDQMRARVERSSDQRWLTVEPMQVWERQELTQDICDQGLQLIAPVLADSTQLNGDVSLDIERLRFPLEDLSTSARVQAMELSGSLQLHSVRARARNPLITSLVQSIGETINFPMPEEIQVVDRSRVRFEMREGRMHHDGLAFVLPQLRGQVVVYSSGSVGLDSTLDLTIQLAISAPGLQVIPVVAQLTDRPFEIHVAGTIEEPQLVLPDSRQLLDELVERIAPADGSPATIGDAIGDLVESTTAEDAGSQENVVKAAAAGIRLFRLLQDRKKEQQSEQTDDDAAKSNRSGQERSNTPPADVPAPPEPMPDR